MVEKMTSSPKAKDEIRWSPEALELWDEIEGRLAELIRSRAEQLVEKRTQEGGEDLITDEDMLEFIEEVLNELTSAFKKP